MNLFTKNIRGFVDFGKQADDLLIKICSKKAVLLNQTLQNNVSWCCCLKLNLILLDCLTQPVTYGPTALLPSFARV